MKKKILSLAIIVLMIAFTIISFTGCSNDKTEEKTKEDNVNSTQQNNTIQNNTDNEIINTNSNDNTSKNLKLDARYTYKSSDLGIQIELYKDNTMYYTYLPRSSSNDSEYYDGTFSINGDILTMNLTPDGDNSGNKVIKNGNTLTCTIISDTEFKDEQGRIIKYSIDYPKK